MKSGYPVGMVVVVVVAVVEEIVLCCVVVVYSNGYGLLVEYRTARHTSGAVLRQFTNLGRAGQVM